MKLQKNGNILLSALSLILSLVSFTAVISQLPNEAIKTALVVSDYSEDSRFNIKYQNAKKSFYSPFLKYLNYSFIKLQNAYELKEITAFKTYNQKTALLRTKQLHNKLYAFSTHQILYNSIV